MAKIDEVVLALGEVVKKQGEAINTLLEMIESMQRNLNNAFREQGYDFAKLAALESSRRRDAIQNSVDVLMEAEEMDPAVRNEIAERILNNVNINNTGTNQDGEILPIQDPRAKLTEASNKGRKQ